LANITDFLKELRRRNVFKAGVAYVIVAWLLMQVIAVSASIYKFPDWIPQAFTLLLFIGFPLILLFAWAFELTPEGLKPTHRVELHESVTSITGRKFDFIIIGLLLIAVIFLALDNYVWVEEESSAIVITTTEEKAEPAVITDRKSIAVLPFANRSKSEDDAYFVDGIHDDILTQLQKITDMKVISRTSVMGYRGTTKNMKTIGEELGVATLLEGGVQRAGSQVRINVQLIDADTDEHLWAEVYDRELTVANIFAIQSEIATAIASALRATLSPEEQERVAAVPTENLAAYEAYLLGKQRTAKRTTEGLAEAVDYFQQAISLDPAFALAYVGLSDAYQLQIGYSGLPQDEMNTKAETAINKALALNENSGEAYTSLGLLKKSRNDFEGSELAFKKALSLNPNYATAYLWYGILLTFSGRDKEASALFQKALTLDPLSIITNMHNAFSHDSLGRFEEAMAQYEKVIEIDPTATQGYLGKAFFISHVYGRLDEAVPLFKKGMSLDPNNPDNNAWLGELYLDLGDHKQAECWLNKAIKLSPESQVTNLFMSYLHVYRNELDKALPYAQIALKLMALKIDLTFRETLLLLRDLDLRTGKYKKASSYYEKTHPTLLAKDEPTINRGNYKAAIDLAYVLQLGDKQERAVLLLDRSLTVIQSGIPRLGWNGYEIADVQIYTMRGEKQQALTMLRQAIDKGWRYLWWYYLEMDPSLESIRNEPEFQAMLTEVKDDMAEQLARVKATEKEGDVCVNP
jgi:TolB-like protein/Flp pilus assembly protein TadD